MKVEKQKLIEEISDFLIIYLKSGKVGLNSFIQKTDLNIANLEQLLKVHFLLKDEVKSFVRNLPTTIRRFKTSTNVENEVYIGQIRGQINWGKTFQERAKESTKLIYSCNERSRFYNIKENLVLKELLKSLYVLLFKTFKMDKLEKYEWFYEWAELKLIVEQIYGKNIYLSKVNLSGAVTDRMILETTKHRNPLYRDAANLLLLYRRILSNDMNKDELIHLFQQTFILPDKEEVLYELYWVIQIIKQNSQQAQLQLIDGRQNLVASWQDSEYTYQIYHDSEGSINIKFQIPTAEIAAVEHPFLVRKIKSMKKASSIAALAFERKIDTTLFWSGRPDVLIEVYSQATGELAKLIIGEVKHTRSVEYAMVGLKELLDYMAFAKHNNDYLDGQPVEVQGMLLTDLIEVKQNVMDEVKIIQTGNVSGLIL
ncbi:hypothetical protein [Bacillus sp. FJAT-27986]|uniref:hypothetical protein n=1 Tax=Bacillus sp. FJAT-27986 TaxID=1743146 RepID=UPI00080AE77E|nr:hypothetical protein [Bacillus sp. FJAT-27986]OCA86167.1 hypothetical protein A8L44_07055 [Bacillus sp. FJAT-27986]